MEATRPLKNPAQKKIILSHIAAVSKNNILGYKNKLPWHIPEDLEYFYRMTKHKALIMGRKTFESLGKALPHRLNVVLSRDKGFKPKRAKVFSSFEEALNFCKTSKMINKYGREIFIGGGGEIYKQTLPLADRLYISRIHREYKGDAFYPEIPKNLFKETERLDRKTPVPFSFLTYDKIRPGLN